MRTFAGYCSARLLPMRRGSRRRHLHAHDDATGKRVVAQCLMGLLHMGELGGFALLRCGILARILESLPYSGGLP